MLSYFTFFFLFTTLLFSQANLSKNAIFDFSKTDYSVQKKVSITAEWAFYHRELISPEKLIQVLKEKKIKSDLDSNTWNSILKNLGKFQFEKVPEEWIEYKLNNEPYVKNFDYGTFILLVKNLPKDELLAFSSIEQGTAFKLFDIPLRNDLKELYLQPVLFNGKTGNSLQNSIPQILPVHKEFFVEEENHILIMQVSNFHHRQGGFWNAVNIGSPQVILRIEESTKAITFISIGVIFIMGLYHFVLFLQRREDKGSFYFGLFCSILLIRIISTDRVLHIIFREASEAEFEALYKLEYLSFYLAPPLFLQFILTIFYKHTEKLNHKTLNLISWSIVIIFCISVVFFPVRVYSFYIKYYYIYSFSFMIYLLIVIIYVFIQKASGAFYSLIGCFILCAFVTNDQLYAMNLIRTGYLSHYGLVLFIFAQSLILSTRFALAFRESEKLSDSMFRFVPNAFLGFLKRNSILEVNLGDAVVKELTVLFLDIREFTRISENLTPKENFSLLNEIFEKINPCILNNGGVIDKYIGDAVMALYVSPESAVKSAIEMQVELNNFNLIRRRNSLPEIEIGIGINTGFLMLGTVGTKERLNTTVIGDTVNLASRLESLNKVFKTRIIISEFTLKAFTAESNYFIRDIGLVRVKGKSINTTIFEIFDFESSEFLKLKQQTKDTLNFALINYRNGNFLEAKKYFLEVIKIFPQDSIGNYYLSKITKFEENPPKNWIGVEDYNLE